MSPSEDIQIKGTVPTASEVLAQQNSPLLELPAELRNTIYRMAVPTGEVFIHLNVSYTRLPALMQVCRQLRQEAGSIYLQENTHRFNVEDLDAKHYIRWCQCSPQHKRANTILRFHYLDAVSEVSGSRQRKLWPNLLAWLQHYHAGDCFGVAQRSNGYLSKVTTTVSEIFQMVDKLGQDHGLHWPQIEAVLENVQGALAAGNIMWKT